MVSKGKAETATPIVMKYSCVISHCSTNESNKNELRLKVKLSTVSELVRITPEAENADVILP